MKQLKSLPKRGARQEELFNFHKKTVSNAREMLTQPTDKSVVDAYAEAVDKFDASLVAMPKNSNTEALFNADVDFDRIYVDAYAYARVMASHPTPVVAAKGKILLDIFDKYKNITGLGYEEEYGFAHHLIQDLTALDGETIETLHFSPWLETLVICKSNFVALRSAQEKEKSEREIGYVKKCRLEADEAYAKFAQFVNAFVLINGEEHYAAFIDLANTSIKQLTTTIKARATRAANAKDKDAQEGEETTPDPETTDPETAPDTNEPVTDTPQEEVTPQE